MKRFLLFVLLASLWLPFGMLSGDYSQRNSLIYRTAGVAGIDLSGTIRFPLALACRALWRGKHVVSAWVTFIVLAPATVWAVLIGGLLGPLGIAIYAIVFSFPAWAVYGFFRHRAKSRPA